MTFPPCLVEIWWWCSGPGTLKGWRLRRTLRVTLNNHLGHLSHSPCFMHYPYVFLLFRRSHVHESLSEMLLAQLGSRQSACCAPGQKFYSTSYNILWDLEKSNVLGGCVYLYMHIYIYIYACVCIIFIYMCICMYIYIRMHILHTMHSIA